MADSRQTQVVGNWGRKKKSEGISAKAPGVRDCEVSPQLLVVPKIGEEGRVIRELRLVRLNLPTVALAGTSRKPIVAFASLLDTHAPFSN